MDALADCEDGEAAIVVIARATLKIYASTI